MTAYSIPANRISTHTKRTPRKRETAPVQTVTVIELPRTEALYQQHRKFWIGQDAEAVNDPTFMFFAPTAPAAWLALPPMRCEVVQGVSGSEPGHAS